MRWQRLQRRSRRLAGALGSVPPTAPSPLQGAIGAPLLATGAGPTPTPSPLLPGTAVVASLVVSVHPLSVRPWPSRRGLSPLPGPRGAPRCPSPAGAGRAVAPRKSLSTGSLRSSPGCDLHPPAPPRQLRDAAGFISALRLTAKSRFEPSLQDSNWSSVAER